MRRCVPRSWSLAFSLLSLLAAACTRESKRGDDGATPEDEGVADDAGDSNDGLQSSTGDGDDGSTGDDHGTDGGDGDRPPVKVRFATFNVAMSDFGAGGLVPELSGDSSHARAIATILQKVRPDVVLINEFDRDGAGEAVSRLVDDYLAVGQAGESPLAFAHRYVPTCNTGELAAVDIDGDGEVKLPGDGYGFGNYPGQYCMVVLSRYPIAETDIRTFQRLRWKDMPGALLPDDPNTAAADDHYAADVLEAFRLSSKTHADVPIDIDGRTVHFLVSHPTPPVFDGPEDANGRRNHDEIRLWADYITPARAAYLVDDAGESGGLAASSRFVIAGDQNADPNDGDTVDGAIEQLLGHPRVNASSPPRSDGAAEQSGTPSHDGDPAEDTATFDLRVDYVLPSTDLELLDSGVFWPTTSDPDHALVSVSDHRLVWIDVQL